MGVAQVICEAFRQHGLEKGTQFFTESKKAKKFTAEQVHLRELAELCFGKENLDYKLHQYGQGRMWVKESVESVTPDVFAAVSGQLMVDRVQEAYQREVDITDQLVDITPNPEFNLSSYKEEVPGTILDNDQQILPGMPYPTAGMSTSTTEIPAPIKRGLTLYIAEETIMANRTGTALKMADDVGVILGQWIAKERLKMILGITGSYNRNGTTLQTYITPASGAAYGNNIEDFQLTIEDGEAQLDELEQVFEDIVDPDRQEPIVITPNQILVARPLKRTLQAVLDATGQSVGDSDVSMVQTPAQVKSYQVFNTRWMKYLLTAAGISAADAGTYLFLGSFKDAFGWREVYPLQTYKANASATDLTPSGPLGQRDIVFATKSRVYGVPYVKNPRFVLRARKMA